MINSVTHVLMYSHYLWTSFGRKNPFKACSQNGKSQFYSCFVHAVLVLTGVWIVRRSQARAGPVQFCYHITMVYLFTFKTAWIPAGPSPWRRPIP